jgi:hypothetical protein
MLHRQKWEYLSIRFDYKGRGITQEFNLLDVNGERVKGWYNAGGKNAKTLPELMQLAGEDGWELVSHVVNQDNEMNGVTFHYMQFKRPLEAETTA